MGNLSFPVNFIRIFSTDVFLFLDENFGIEIKAITVL